jgi:hypothetical protein
VLRIRLPEADARSHDHREHTEIDSVPECAAGATVERDGERVVVGPGGAVLIPPGVRPVSDSTSGPGPCWRGPRVAG